jgi:hypothetical protein
MRRIKRFLSVCLIIVLAGHLLGCAKAPSVQPVEESTNNVDNTKTAIAHLSAELELTSFSELVLSTNTAFLGTAVSNEWIDGVSILNASVLKTVFRVDEDLYDNLPDGVVTCYSLGLSSGVGAFHTESPYTVGNQYVLLTTGESRLFHPETEFFPIAGVLLDVTNQSYQIPGETLPFENYSQLRSEIRKVWQNSSRIPAGIMTEENGTWDSADFIAEVELVGVVNPASPIFTGTCYRAKVTKLFKGKEEDLRKPFNGCISLTLSAAQTETGRSYVVGFSTKNGATSAYTQEGLDTLSFPETFDQELSAFNRVSE